MSSSFIKSVAVLVVAVLGVAFAPLPAAGRTPEAAAAPARSGIVPAAPDLAGAPARAPLPRPASLVALQARAAREGRPVVALFSTAGCGWCEALRAAELRHLAREADARGVLVVEFDLADARPFGAGAGAAGDRARRADGAVPAAAEADWARAESPAALARLLGIRVAPTVAFLGPRGGIAEPLVGYASPDFYGAYLDQRIAQSRAAITRR